jgi:DNA-binding XRE family transcriptional regulator
MPTPLRISFARLCRDTRVMLDITQAELAAAVGVSRAQIASIESGRANPSLEAADRIGRAPGLELELLGRAPVAFSAPAQRDAVHAWCSGYAGRRLARHGLDVRREVTIGTAARAAGSICWPTIRAGGSSSWSRSRRGSTTSDPSNDNSIGINAKQR